MAALAKPHRFQQQWLKASRRSLYTRSNLLYTPNPARIVRRYGPPIALAAVTAGYLSSSLSPCSFSRPIHNDAPKPSAWQRLAPGFLQTTEQKDTSTTTEEAKDAVDSNASSGQQAPPPQTRVVKDGEEYGQSKVNDKSGPWQGFTSQLANATTSFSSLGDTIADYVLPTWAKVLPAYVKKIQNELSMAPGSLAEEIWYDANNPEIHEEIMWDASVRVSNELCREEKQFLKKRALVTKRALARYLDIPEATIHPDDVPVIAMCGSGGGLRALVAGTSSYLSAHEAGLFDCVTYTAGVSGSCWLQTLYYSNITERSHARLIRHLKNRLGVHIAFPPDALELVASAPTNKYLLSGLVEKAKGTPQAEFGIVDIYGLLLAARLLVPKGELSVAEKDFKVSNQREFTDNGSQPLPIYTAVRHEIPLAEQEDTKDPIAAEAKARKEAWFQWFEFTPYEFWCEEWEAGIPTWALGRTFKNGRTVWRDNELALPELRVPMLMGIWGSAFCATLSHYYQEIRPTVKGLTGFGGLDDLISERKDDMVKMHPIDPAAMPNFALGMRDYLPPSCPESIFKEENLKLMDAGMSNNLPIYPLLRPGRDVDVLIAFDASADVKTDNWLKVAEGYARQRGIKGWPVGAGWPPVEESIEELQQDLDEAQAKTSEQAREKFEEAKRNETEQSEKKKRKELQQDLDEAQAKTSEQAREKFEEAKRNETEQSEKKKRKELSFCNIWVGTTEERTNESEPPSSKLDDDNWELMGNSNGITVIYYPFLANPKVEGVDPKTSDFMSTWNFIYTPEQIDSVVELARTNFNEGAERTKRTIRAVYERKKAAREQREAESKERRRRWKLRQGRAGGRRVGENDHGDQFS